MNMNGPMNDAIWTRANKHLLNFGCEFASFVPARAEGTFLYDAQGNRMLDFTSGQMLSLIHI